MAREPGWAVGWSFFPRKKQWRVTEGRVNLTLIDDSVVHVVLEVGSEHFTSSQKKSGQSFLPLSLWVPLGFQNWKIPWTEETGRLQSMGWLRVSHDWATSLSLSCIGEGKGNPLQCSCLENPGDRGAWWAAVYGVTQSRTRLKWLSSSSSSRLSKQHSC